MLLSAFFSLPAASAPPLAWVFPPLWALCGIVAFELVREAVRTYCSTSTSSSSAGSSASTMNGKPSGTNRAGAMPAFEIAAPPAPALPPRQPRRVTRAVQFAALSAALLCVLVASSRLAWVDHRTRESSGPAEGSESTAIAAAVQVMHMWHLLLAGLWVAALSLSVRCSAACADVAASRAYVAPLTLGLTPEGWAPVPPAPQQRREHLFVFPHEDMEG